MFSHVQLHPKHKHMNVWIGTKFFRTLCKPTNALIYVSSNLQYICNGVQAIFWVTYPIASLQLFNKSVTIVVTISVKASKTSGTSFNRPSREVLVFSINPVTAETAATKELDMPSLRRSKKKEMKLVVTSIERSTIYSRQPWTTFLTCSSALWARSPGTLNAWINCTRTWAVVLKIKRDIRFDIMVTMKKMNFKRKTTIGRGFKRPNTWMDEEILGWKERPIIWNKYCN